MKGIHFSVKPTASTKSQALEVIRQLKETIPLERAQMTVRVILPIKDAKATKTAIAHHFVEVESEDFTDELEMVCPHISLRVLFFKNASTVNLF